MRSPKRSLTFLGCAAVCGLCVLGMLRVFRRSSAPLDRAQAVTQTTTWQPDRRNPDAFPMYYWSGSNDLTYFSKGTDGTPHLFRRSATTPGKAPGKEGPAVYLRGGRYAGQLSPDGKWFVEWHRNKLRQSLPTFVSMDGTQRREGQPTWGTEGVWTPDSASMVSEVWRSGGALDRYDPTTGLKQTATLPGLENFYSFQNIDSSGHLVAFKEGPLILHFGKLTGIPTVNYPTAKMIRLDVAHPEIKPDQWTVAVPQNIDDNGICLLAPTCDRILWIVHGDTTPPILRRLRRYIPRLSTSYGVGYRWLVSGLHGEEMHEVASYRSQALGTIGSPHDVYSRPRWMPDGRHISFIFRNTLYTRSIE